MVLIIIDNPGPAARPRAHAEIIGVIARTTRASERAPPPRAPPEVEEDDSANKRPRRATRSEPTYAGADSRSGTSSSEEDDFDAESEAASEAVSDEVSSPGSSPGGAANASVYEGDEGETLEDLIADNY